MHNVWAMDEPSEQFETTTRRGWLSALARDARRKLQEGAEAVGPDGLQGLLGDLDPFSEAGSSVADPASDPFSGGPIGDESGRRPARVPTQALSTDALITLAHEEGLTGRDDTLRTLARPSLRMTPVASDRATAWIHTGDEWVLRDGSEVLLAQIDLAATQGAPTPLPTDGWLVLFAGTDPEPSGGEGFHAHAVILEHPAEVLPGAEPVALGPELSLPRVWNDAVQALDLDETAAAAYLRVRASLQERQGVEPDDDGGPLIAYHRLLGYPDDTTGTMPLECAAPGADPNEWRLLAQVSVGHFRRVYVWIHESDLTANRFEDLRIFVR